MIGNVPPALVEYTSVGEERGRASRVLGQLNQITACPLPDSAD